MGVARDTETMVSAVSTTARKRCDMADGVKREVVSLGS